jgi:hypothetical protein
MNRKLMRLIYRSVPTRVMRTDDIEALVAASAAANAFRGITGALLFDGTAFGQVLEGEAGQLEALYEKISCDRRHRALFLLEYSAITARTFTDWHMKGVQTEDRLACLEGTSSDSARQIVGTLMKSLTKRGLTQFSGGVRRGDSATAPRPMTASIGLPGSSTR